MFENRVELYVIERSRFEGALQEARIEIPEHVKVITVSELSARETDIYAGLALYSCTSGFAVKNSSGTMGILTAGHCNDIQYYNGISLPMVGNEAYFGPYDFQWHTAPGFTVRNLAFDGTYNRYIYSTKHRNNQAINSWVCHYGMTSGYACGFIIDKNFKPGEPGSTWTPTYMLVHSDDVDLSALGDSGGPWFSGNTAYGVHSGGFVNYNDAYYMAINYVDYLDLTVLLGKIYLPLILNEQSHSQTMSGSGYTNPYPPPNNEIFPVYSSSDPQPNPYP